MKLRLKTTLRCHSRSPEVIVFSWPISTVAISSSIPTANILHRHHFVRSSDVPADWRPRAFRGASSAWLQKLFKHLWPVVFLQSCLGIKLRRNISLAEHEIGFGYAASCTGDTITPACPLVAALSTTREDNKVYYTTVSLLLYLEKITVGAFSSSAPHL